MNDFLKRAWARIDLDSLGKNLRVLSEHAHGTQICAVVKANAYGHDDISIARYLEEKGVSFFAVSNIKEALILRDSGIKGEILILGYTPPYYARELAASDIIQCAVDETHAVEISIAAAAANVSVKLHMAVDTGMGRIGELPENAPAAAERIAKLPGIILDGAFTHYAAADSYDESDIAYTKEQTERFFRVCDEIRQRGIQLRHTHCLNSAGGLFAFDERSTLIRDGILIYGLKPDRSLAIPFELEQVMTLKAALSYVKQVPAGTYVSYGRTYRTDSTRSIATVPIGYADGYPRSLSNKGHVLINGKRAPIVGRVCMDQLMIDVTDIGSVTAGSVATLIGRDGDETITADDIAELTGTIGYEIVCGISKRVPRVIVKDGEIISVREYY